MGMRPGSGLLVVVPAREPYHAGIAPVTPASECATSTSWLLADSARLHSVALRLPSQSLYEGAVAVPPLALAAAIRALYSLCLRSQSEKAQHRRKFVGGASHLAPLVHARVLEAGTRLRLQQPGLA